MSTSKLAALSLLTFAACGGSKAPPANPPASDPPAEVTSATAAPPATAAASAPPTTTASASPITLTAELPKPPAKPPAGAYPKPSVSYKDCWAKVGLSGAAQKDYDAIIASCGVPTGMLEYAAPSSGDFGG